MIRRIFFISFAAISFHCQAEVKIFKVSYQSVNENFVRTNYYSNLIYLLLIQYIFLTGIFSNKTNLEYLKIGLEIT